MRMINVLLHEELEGRPLFTGKVPTDEKVKFCSIPEEAYFAIREEARQESLAIFKREFGAAFSAEPSTGERAASFCDYLSWRFKRGDFGK